VARSIVNPLSLVELSVHARLIWFDEAAEAMMLPGALGIVAEDCVVAYGAFE
jgi:hypothetical protein